jgi:hypothetical protein
MSCRDEYRVTVTRMIPSKPSGAEMNALSRSRPGTDHRVVLNAVPTERLVPSTNPLRTKVSPPVLLFKEIPSGSG